MPRSIIQSISPLPIRIEELQVDKSKLKIKNLIITEIGHLPGRHSRRSNASFDKWALAYIADGTGYYQANNGSVQQVAGGNLFFVYPDAVFNYGPNKGSSWEEFYITFEGSRIVEMVESGLLTRGALLDVGTDSLWRQRIESIMNLMESGIHANLDRASLSVESLLFEFSLMNQPIQNVGKPQRWHTLLEELSSHIYYPIDDQLIAQRLSISVSTLRRLVRINTGYSLNGFIHRLKISEAKKRLVNSSASIKEIALSLRYDDVYYFSRLFRKITGSSARSFRENI